MNGNIGADTVQVSQLACPLLDAEKRLGRNGGVIPCIRTPRTGGRHLSGNYRKAKPSGQSHFLISCHVELMGLQACSKVISVIEYLM